MRPLPRPEQYNPVTSASVGRHYDGRFEKAPYVPPGPARQAVRQAILSRRYEKALSANASRTISIETDYEMDSDINPLEIEDAKNLSNPIIEQYDDRLVLISSDDNITLTIKTNNPDKVLETILT